MSPNKIIGLILCGCVGVGAYIFAEDAPTAKGAEVVSVPKLATLQEEDRMKVLSQLYADRDEFANRLINQLDPANPKEVNFAIAYVLGVYRCEQAVPHLNKYITLTAEPKRRMPLWDVNPVVEALARIGNPAIPQMLQNIENSSDDKTRQLSVNVIRIVLGPDVAKVVLEKGGEGKSDVAKANFKAAVEYLDTQLALLASNNKSRDPNVEEAKKQKLKEMLDALAASQPSDPKEVEAKIKKIREELEALEAASASQPASRPIK